MAIKVKHEGNATSRIVASALGGKGKRNAEDSKMLAQKAAQENIAANRQLQGARSAPTAPGRANASTGHASLMNAPIGSISRMAHEKAMREAQIAAQKERDKTLHGYDMEKAKKQQENDLAKWYRQQEYEEEKRIEAENLKYGIPLDADISIEDRAKIINGKGAYKYFYGRTPKEEEDIQALKDSIAKDTASPIDRQVLEHRLGVYEIEHPMRGMAVPVPKEEMPPQTTVIKGVTYMNNNGKWEPVQTPKQETPVPTEPQIITREDGTKWLGNGKGGFTPYTDPKDAARQKYMQDLLKKEVPTGKNATEGGAITRPLTPQEIAEEMARYDEVVLGKKNTPLVTQRVNPVTGLLEVALNGAPTNPMAGGSEAQPPSVAPTPAPTAAPAQSQRNPNIPSAPKKGQRQKLRGGGEAVFDGEKWVMAK